MGLEHWNGNGIWNIGMGHGNDWNIGMGHGNGLEHWNGTW